jgi:hypothetical protein
VLVVIHEIPLQSICVRQSEFSIANVHSTLLTSLEYAVRSIYLSYPSHTEIISDSK